MPVSCRLPEPQHFQTLMQLPQMAWEGSTLILWQLRCGLYIAFAILRKPSQDCPQAEISPTCSHKFSLILPERPNPVEE